MTEALWITLIGMGLVFLAILLLWGGMALLVRLTEEREESGAEEDEGALPAGSEVEAPAASQDMQKRRTSAAAAAAAAVAVALALRKPARRENGGAARAGGALSAWQAVNRTSQVNQGMNISRKKVAR